MRRLATARGHLPGLVAYVWEMAEASAGGGRGHWSGRGCFFPPPVEGSSPEQRGLGSAACPALSLDRGPERLGNLPKLTQLRLPVAMSLLWHPLAPQAEGSWLLLGTPVMGGQYLFTLGRVFTQESKIAEALGSPALAWRALQGTQGAAGCGEVEGEEGMQALRESVSRVPSGHGSGPDREARTCSERLSTPRLSREGQTERGHRATKQQPRAKRTSLLTPHLVPRVEEDLGASKGRKHGGCRREWVPRFPETPVKSKATPQP